MRKKMFSLLMAVSTVASTFTGCSSSGTSSDETTEKAAVSYVIANTANSQGLNFNSPLIQDTVYKTIRNYGYISVINADGTPEVVMANDYDIDEKYKNASADKLDTEASANATNVIAAMQGVTADDPEVDYLAALKLAVRSMASLEGYDSKTIVVLGTGLGTTGTLNFCNNILSADPETVVNLLNEKEAIPDFQGIAVYWQQMGDVAAPQEALSDELVNKEQEIYAGIVEAGGGTFQYNDIIANPTDETTAFPEVSVVDLPEDTPIQFDEEELQEESEETETAFEQPVVLSEDQVRFVEGSAEYADPDAAAETLQPIADYLVQHETVNIVLAGTTAGDDDDGVYSDEYRADLSGNRAATVRSTLIDMGVNGERITSVGLGSHDPWHIYDAGYDSAAASANRKVVIIDASSDTAKEIIG